MKWCRLVAVMSNVHFRNKESSYRFWKINCFSSKHRDKFPLINHVSDQRAMDFNKHTCWVFKQVWVNIFCTAICSPGKVRQKLFKVKVQQYVYHTIYAMVLSGRKDEVEINVYMLTCCYILSKNYISKSGTHFLFALHMWRDIWM